MTEILLSSLRENGVLTLTMNRPEVKNALDEHLIKALTDAIEKGCKSDAVRVIVLQGSDGFFCAGADLNWMKRVAAYTRDENVDDALKLAHLLRMVADCSKPTIAHIEGGAFGGGVGLAAACDMAIASEKAVFCLSEVRLGLIPAVISPYLLNAMGARQAKKLTLTAERFCADEAMRLGLAHQVVEAGMTQDAVDKTLSNILKGGPAAHTASKRLFSLVSREKNSERLMDVTASLIADVRVSPEGREGIAAFLEKREPKWVGENK